MEAKIENAIKLLVDKSLDNVRGDDALKFTQAALNLAHVAATLAHAKQLAASS